MASGYSMRDEDFQEEDVWGVMKERSEDLSPKARKVRDYSFGSTSTPRMIIPRANNSEAKMAHQQSSAPVNIPDWSKIYRKNKKNSKKGSWVDDGGDDGDDVDDYDYDYDDEMVPPHEYVAKKLARSQISSHSMCEGIGRTLKGRDLSKVRNAILTKTGFLE
ncbi:hypothetical protein CsSME_00030992 [Camellia sinensis var. sinensis]